VRAAPNALPVLTRESGWRWRLTPPCDRWGGTQVLTGRLQLTGYFLGARSGHPIRTSR
jgi:hypothetical protein